jgi:hypothetical protein
MLCDDLIKSMNGGTGIDTAETSPGMEMTSRKRVLAALRQCETDKVPVHHLGFSSEVASALLGREAYVGGGIQQWREACSLWQGGRTHKEFLDQSFQDAIDIALLCEHDIVRPSYWRHDVPPTQRVDEYTFLYEHGPESSWTVLRFDPDSEQCNLFACAPRSRRTLDDLEEQVTVEERASAEYQPREDDFSFEIRAQRLLGQERVVRVGGVGVGLPLQDTEAWFEAMALRPDLVARHLDSQVELARRNVEFLVPFGFRLFFGGADFASNTGPMYSPSAFRDLVLPRLMQVSEVCHQHGSAHLFASDGNLWPVAGPLFGQSGIDGYYEIDRRAGMDLGQLRDRFPCLTLLGNISSHTLHLGSREEVIAETVSCLEEAAHHNGIIVGASNYIVPHTPIDNVIAMLDTIRDYR